MRLWHVGCGIKNVMMSHALAWYTFSSKARPKWNHFALRKGGTDGIAVE